MTSQIKIKVDISEKAFNKVVEIIRKYFYDENIKTIEINKIAPNKNDR